jgi:hypothetical protein
MNVEVLGPFDVLRVSPVRNPEDERTQLFVAFLVFRVGDIDIDSTKNPHKFMNLNFARWLGRTPYKFETKFDSLVGTYTVEAYFRLSPNDNDAWFAYEWDSFCREWLRT